MDKKIRNERNITDYSGLSDISHVYTIPDTYIGSTKPHEFETYGLNIENLKFEKVNSDLPEGVRRVFLEISF